MIELPQSARTIVSYCLVGYNFFKYGFLVLLYTIYAKIFDKPITKQRLNPPKSLTDAQYGSHGYLSVKGVKIHYMERGDKNKPLLLFVHGFPEFWFSWRYQLMEFSNDYWCVAMDLRGFGYSDKPDGIKNYAIDVVVDEIKDFVQLLGKDRFTIVGHDWGTLLTASFVDRYGDMLEKYVIMSAPSSDIYYKTLWSDYEQFKKSWYIFLFAAPFIPEQVISLNDFEMLDKAMGAHSNKYVTSVDVEAYKYTYSKPGALTPPLNYYRCEILSPNCTEIRKPIRDDLKGLFLIGEKDPYVTSQGPLISEMKAKYKNLQIEVLKDCYHFIQQENPEEINARMRKFFSE